MRKPPKPNKTAITLLSLLGAVVILLSLYLAVIAPLLAADDPDAETTPLVTLPGEGLGITGTAAMMFPRVERKDMRAVRVFNAYSDGTGYVQYAFLRDTEDADGDGDVYDFIIESYPAHTYDEKIFAELVVGVGYTTYLTRLDALALYDKSEAEKEAVYADFGLSADDHPVYYELTTMDDTTYTVYLGERSPDGNYYARLLGRDAVYVVPASVGDLMKKPISYYANPMLTFEADAQYSYLYIQNFAIFHDDTFENIFFGGEEKTPDISQLSPYVMFTYLPKPQRDPFHANSIYAMLAPDPAYTPYDNHVDLTLQELPGLTGTEVLKLGLSAADFASDGLLSDVAYTIYYEMPYGVMVDENQDPAAVEYWVKNVLFVTHPGPDGMYTVGSLSYREGDKMEVFYHMIAKVDEKTLSFLTYSQSDWVEPSMFNVDINDVDSLEVSSAYGDYFYEITGDGGYDQTVTEKYSGYQYTYQGEHVPFRVNEQGYCEDIEQFRSFYLMLIQLEYEGALADDDAAPTPAEREQMMADDSHCLLSFTVTMEDSRSMTYRFYPYSERHAMVSVSGDEIGAVHSFYTSTAAVRRLAGVTWQLANGVEVDSTYRYQ